MALTKVGKEGITGISNSSDATAITISSGEVVTLADDLIIKDSGTIGSASKTDAITIASSGLVQLTSTGIGAGSQVLQVIDDGATLFQIRSEDGNISFPQSGAGIYLGVTSGNAANLLDDYEEGTWTPQLTDLTNNATMHSLNGGVYTKVGRLVSCTANVRTTSLGSVSGALYLTGFPFASANTNGNHGAGSVANAENMNITAGHSIQIYYSKNGSQGRWDLYDSTGGITALQASEWSSDGQASIQVSYSTA